jgi:hypothetical protein
MAVATVMNVSNLIDVMMFPFCPDPIHEDRGDSLIQAG